MGKLELGAKVTINQGKLTSVVRNINTALDSSTKFCVRYTLGTGEIKEEWFYDEQDLTFIQAPADDAEAAG